MPIDADRFPLGETAERITQEEGEPVTAWHIRRAIQRGFLPEPPRVACYRVFSRADFPRVKEALRRAGYLPAIREVSHAG